MGTTENLDAILAARRAGEGMDAVIVSTASPDLAAWWRARLEAGRGGVCGRDARIWTVVEDWPGGAGNGLGTLFAVREADRLARESGEPGPLELLDAGAAVALYHTAGKGTRLAPLPGAEGGNKSAVKLPGLVDLGGRVEPLTILEAVIRQTAVYATARRGRLSVFWGDQVFVPSAPLPAPPRHHVDILAGLGPLPDADAWRRDGLERYGLVAVGADGNAVQVEKTTHAAATSLIDAGVLDAARGIGVSLGSFGLSAALVRALCDEFAPELDARSAKLDTDPHFWMPMTLPAAAYADAMAAKGESRASADAHHRRMAAFAARFAAGRPGAPLVGCTDVGREGWWWDYGTVPSYAANLRRLLDGDDEARAMRVFFGVEDGAGHLADGVERRDGGLLIGCRVGRGRCGGSVLVAVTAAQVDVADSVLVDVAAPRVAGEDLLIYHVFDDDVLAPRRGAVCADAFPAGHDRVRLTTRCDRDGKDDWDAVLPGNPVSYARLAEWNASSPLAAGAAAARAARERVVASLAGEEP